MSFLEGKNKNIGNILIVDFRSFSVGVALLVIDGKNKSKIIYSDRQFIYFDNVSSISLKSYLEKSYANLKKVLESFLAKSKTFDYKKVDIDEIFIIYGSPWYRSSITNLHFEDKKEFVFNKDFFNKKLKNAKFSSDIKEGEVILDEKLVSITINGYRTKNPFDRKTNIIDLSYYRGIIDKKTKTETEKNIKSVINTKKFKHQSHINVIFSVIKDLYKSSSNFIIIDISGEITDISLCKNNKFISIFTIPKGINFFARGLMEKCDLSFQTALSSLKLMTGSTLDEKCSEKTVDIFNELKQEWLEEIKKSVKKYWKNESVPPVIFLTADNTCSEMIKKAIISRETFTDVFKMNREPSVHVLNSSHVKELIDYNKEVPRDALLSVISHYIEISE